jgi:radical SAM superfamily enzyme YgiQ (UPF0313 family)
MEIAFISLVEDVSIPGIRSLSAYLRAKGHHTTLILLPWSFTDRALSDYNSFLYPYPNEILQQVAETCSSSNLVGISMMSCHFDNAIHITNFLHSQLDVPIIWGGIHPTLRPAECLEYADMVCVGEGEISLYMLASQMSEGKPWELSQIPGIYKRGDKELSLPISPSPIIGNLDELPLPDYDLGHQFILYEGNVVRLNSDLLVACLSNVYRTLFSRGCPYACAYCCNNAIRRLHQHKLPVRWRGIDDRMKELKTAIELMPQLRRIVLADDAFLSQPTEVIRSFAERYSKEIGLPLEVLAIPSSINESKIEMLAEAGLDRIGIGIQSGSEHTLRNLYSRRESPTSVLSASTCIKLVARKTKKRIVIRYDFILDNPWEAQQDVEASIRLCMKLEKPRALALFSLTLYPETELYLKARSEGLISDDLNQVYRRSQLAPSRNYLNGVFTALQANAPNWVATLLLYKHIRRLSPVWPPYLIALIFKVVTSFRKFRDFYGIKTDWTSLRFLITFPLPLLRARLLTLHSKSKKGDSGGRRPKFYGPAGRVR